MNQSTEKRSIFGMNNKTEMKGWGILDTNTKMNGG